jgi:hypothetical protein
MKHNFYTLLHVSTLLLVAWMPRKAEAQCTCSDGLPASIIEHTVILMPTMSSSNVISFPKFDPSIGDLSCIYLFDTISIVTRSGAKNMDTTSAHEPTFRLTVNPSISGPGLSMTHLTDVIYGPDSIQIHGTPGDSLAYGPDTVYKNFAQQKSITNYAAYSGLGNVNLNYNINGGMISIGDGSNYDFSVRTTTWGIFRIVYNWCPTSLLARHFSRFTAIKKENNIQLRWSVNNEEATNSYDIQISYDGLRFVNVGQAASQYAGQGATAEYYYEHLLKQAAAGKLYFRIRQKDAAGKESFSPIRIITVDENGVASMAIYPNPVQRKVSLQFDRILNSRFAVDIVNASGQLLLQHLVNVNNNSLIQFELTKSLAPGIYYLRAQDLTTRQIYLNKLVIQ